MECIIPLLIYIGSGAGDNRNRRNLNRIYSWIFFRWNYLILVGQTCNWLTLGIGSLSQRNIEILVVGLRFGFDRFTADYTYTMRM